MIDERDLDRIVERLQVIEDKDAIHGMMKGWRALEHKDWYTWISHWAEDATFEFGRCEPLRGRQAIRETVVGAESPYLHMEHQILDMHIGISGDEATGIGYTLFVGVADEKQGQNPYLMGVPYTWDWVREEDVISAFNNED